MHDHLSDFCCIPLESIQSIYMASQLQITHLKLNAYSIHFAGQSCPHSLVITTGHFLEFVSTLVLDGVSVFGLAIPFIFVPCNCASSAFLMKHLHQKVSFRILNYGKSG